MKKISVTDFWGKSKHQIIFHKVVSTSTFIASRVELTHLSAPHCVQIANAIDVFEGLIGPAKALWCLEIWPSKNRKSDTALHSRISSLNVERNFISFRVLWNEEGKETVSQHKIGKIWYRINYFYVFMWPRISDNC